MATQEGVFSQIADYIIEVGRTNPNAAMKAWGQLGPLARTLLVAKGVPQQKAVFPQRSIHQPQEPK